MSLDNAFEATVDNRKVFLGDIIRATEYLKEANSNLHSVSSNDQDAVEIVREAMEVLDIAIRHLKVDHNR